MPTEASIRQEESPSETTVALARSSGEELARLVRSEIALARRELREDVRALGASGSVAGASALFGVAGAALVLGSIVVAGRRHPLVLGMLGLGLLALATSLGSAALDQMRPVMDRTRRRIADDAARIEESLR